jgi:hypothetical protein
MGHTVTSLQQRLIRVFRDEREVVWRLKKVQKFFIVSDIQKNARHCIES